MEIGVKEWGPKRSDPNENWENQKNHVPEGTSLLPKLIHASERGPKSMGAGELSIRSGIQCRLFSRLSFPSGADGAKDFVEGLIASCRAGPPLKYLQGSGSQLAVLFNDNCSSASATIGIPHLG